MILAEAEVPGWRLLIPLPQEIVWSAVFLLIFALVFIRFVLPRMNAVLDERSEKIEGGIRHAEQAQAQADQLKADQEQELAAARQEAASIRDKARQDGQRIVEEAKARAEAESELCWPRAGSSWTPSGSPPPPSCAVRSETSPATWLRRSSVSRSATMTAPAV